MHILPLLLIPALIWIFIEASRMGLNSENPPDPTARVDLYANRALATIKQELIGANILSLDEGQVRYRRGQQPRRLWSENGSLHLQNGEAPPAQVHPLGDQGTLNFHLDERTLICEILVRETGGSEKLLKTRLTTA